MTTERGSTRAAAVYDLMVLDTPREQAFDDLVLLAAHACDVPIALISLLDDERQWFKAKVGVEICQTDIGASVCQIELEEAALLEIGDLAADERTRANPLVTGEAAFRFYAGSPLILRSGEVVGRLCAIDTAPRPDGLSDTQKTLLAALARQVSEHLELRRIANASERLAELQSALVELGDQIRASPDVGSMTRAAAAIVGRVLEVDRAGFGLVDDAVEYIDIEPDWTAPGVPSVAGRHRFEDYGAIRSQLLAGEPLVIEDVATDARTAHDPAPMRSVGIQALMNMPVRQNGRTIAVFIVNSSAPRRWTAEELAFLRNVADRLEAGVARFRVEQQQVILNGEISHRLKNMLAMVQAIASQTLRSVPDREPVQNFERRLMALSAAHDVLLPKRWASADLQTVADAVVETVGFVDRVHMAGPPVPLGARAALSFSLIVHELMTNACKYGSLCVEGGRVDIEWSVSNDAENRKLTLSWKESGGPEVSPPSRAGFGSRLMRAGLVGTGGVDLRYERNGFEAYLEAALNDLAQV